MTEPLPISPDAPPLMLTYNSPEGVPGHWTNVSIHRPDEGRFWGTYLRNLGMQLLLRVPRLAIIILLWWYFDPYKDHPEIRWYEYMMFAVVVPVSLVLGMVVRYRRERRAFLQMEIVVSDQGVLRRGGGAPALELTRAEIRKMEERPSGIAVIGRPAARWIHLPRALLGFAEVRARLAEWVEIPYTLQTVRRRVLTQGLVFLLAMLSGAAVVGFLFGNTWLRSLGLCYLIGTMAYAVRFIVQSPNLTPFQKTRSYISIGLIMLYLVGIFVGKFYTRM